MAHINFIRNPDRGSVMSIMAHCLILMWAKQVLITRTIILIKRFLFVLWHVVTVRVCVSYLNLTFHFCCFIFCLKKRAFAEAGALFHLFAVGSDYHNNQ